MKSKNRKRCTCPRNHFVPSLRCPVHGEAAKQWAKESCVRARLGVGGLARLYDLAHAAETLPYGSDEQITAQNEFGDTLRRVLSTTSFARWEQYALKATTREMIDYGWQLLDTPNRHKATP